MANLDPKVMVELKKLSSAKLCSSVVGQTCMDAVVNPPKEHEPSYELFIKVNFKMAKNLFPFILDI
jgi:alanine transaminase